MKKAIMDKSAALKVAHTRLEARSHRVQSELVGDYAQIRYLLLQNKLEYKYIKQIS